MTDEEIRWIVAAYLSSEIPHPEIILLSDEALRRGQEVARLEREHAGRNVVEAERLALILRMEQRIARLEAALRFYADPVQYQEDATRPDSDDWPIDADRGTTARTALEEKP